MKRTNTKRSSPNDHLETLGHLLTQLKTHLTTSAEKKGTYGDYLRLLEFYREARDTQAGQIIIGCVDDENALAEPSA